MNKQILKILIGEYQKLAINMPLIERNICFEDEVNYILVGIRRAGKSYLLYQNIQSKIASGNMKADDFLYINFEDERISDITSKELGDLIDSYKEMYGKDCKYIYLDEVQNIEGWEKFARRLADMKYNVMITGSNAKMLSHELATTLGGRFIPRNIEPFTFAEYLQSEHIEVKNNWEYDPDIKLKVYKAFETYFHFGGFAESFHIDNKREYINSLYQKILLGDIVERHKIRNSRIFRLLGRKLAESIMQPTTLTRLRRIICSTGENISLPILKDYLEYFKESCLIISVPNMASTLSEQETTKKRYFIDNGILNLFLVNEDSKLLENIVAINLNSIYKNTEEDIRLFYYNRNIEVDFCIPEAKVAIQVSYNYDNNLDTYEREVGSLKTFLRSHTDYVGIIITYNQECEVEVDNKKIQVIPIWKWLLRTEQ